MRSESKRILPRLGVVCFGCLVALASATADVVTDSTVGPAGPLAGPNITIPADVGRQAGKNLFHSFKTFNIYRGESATFTGPSGLDNVISRVTGGERSTIDGLLSSKIPNADFWFLNPSGVVFGPNAQLDLPASFHVSTADELRFEDGAVFSARDPSASTLTVTAPEAFGFVGQSSAGVTVNESKLDLKAGKTLSLVGGDIAIKEGAITAEHGRVNLVSLAGPGRVAVPEATTTMEARGAIQLTDRAFVETSGDGGGTVRIRSGSFVLDNSFVWADNTGEKDSSSGIDIAANRVNIHSSSSVNADTYATGRAGSVSVDVAGPLVVDAGVITSRSYGAGDAGMVTVEASKVTLSNSSQISSSVLESSTGKGGNVTVTAREGVSISGSSSGIYASNRGAMTSSQPAGDATVKVTGGGLEVTDGGVITSLTSTGGNAGKVSVDVAGPLVVADDARIGSQSGSSGNAGPVTVTAAEIQVRSGGAISSNTYTGGRAGPVSVDVAGPLVVDAGWITSQSYGAGDAGTVTVRASNVKVSGGGQINSSPLKLSTGKGGNVTVTAREGISISGSGWMLDGEDWRLYPSGIYASNESATTSSQPAGDVTVKVTGGRLEITDGGEINTSTRTGGDAGKVSVDVAGPLIVADNPVVDPPPFRIPDNYETGISSRAEEGSSGNAGTVTVAAGELTLRSGGRISTSTSTAGDAGKVSVDVAGPLVVANSGADGGISSRAEEGSSGNAGTVTVAAGELTLRSGGRISSSSSGSGDAGQINIRTPVVRLTGSMITTESLSTGGGQISIQAHDLIDLNNSTIASTVFGGEDTTAGDITIDPEFLILNNSDILARATQGRGGNIHIDADFIVRSAESRIDASSERGINGTITATNPEIDLSKGLRELPVDFLDASAQMPLSCEARRASGESSFGMIGRGVPPGPDAPSPGFYLLDKDAGAGPGTSDSGKLSEVEEVEIASFGWPTIQGDCSTR